MNSIRVDIRLRPIRFGFLVRPDDEEKVLDIFRINTCLWGGRFNPIIPFFQDVPSWWERGNYRFEDVKQIINGYLDFFEPDFLVEAEKGIADGFGFDTNRVLQLADILEDPVEGGWNEYGLSVHDLYSKLYNDEFQFESRHKHNIMHVEAKDNIFDGFVAAHFGSFPVQEQFGYFEQNYKGIFDPKYITLDAATFLDMYESGWTSALGIGCAKFRIDYYARSDPALFILDAQESVDLVDFWNLRAVSQNIVPIPLQWIEDLSLFCKKFILNNYRLARSDSDDVSVYPTSMFSRSIPDNDIEEIHKNYLHVDKERANTLQTWYPPIWRKPSEKVFSPKRPILEADKRSMDIQVDADNPSIQFEPLFPEFVSEHGSKFRLANVVQLQDWGNADQIATVFPCNYRNPSLPTFQLIGEHLLPTTEGFVVFPEYRNVTELWNLVDGATAFQQWFNSNEISSVLSDAGRATQQIIQTLGGFWAVGRLANKGVIELLNEMSKHPITKTAHYKEFQNKIHNAITDERLRNLTFETLVKCKVVELGLELKCSKCGSWNWYSVKGLDYSLVCDLCLKQFGFPTTSPVSGKYSRWAYRLVGPFALPGYANGGYAAALTIRFFANVVSRISRSAVTWASGQELKLLTGKKVEVDFMLWHQRKQIFGMDHPTERVFGEAKSFGRDAFAQDDINKIQSLAETFPCSILVFATMREATELCQEEINRIKKLAEWGREYDKERQQTRAPVIVLTGTELFATESLERSWKEKGGMHEALIRPGWIRTDNLRVLADLTQRLYLGMPSYDSVPIRRSRQQNQLPERASTQPDS